MAKQLFINNFQSQFTAPVKSAPTTGDPDNELDYGILRISSGAAVFLTQLTDGDWYTMTGYKKSGSVESNIEILKVLAVDSSVVNELRLYVSRGQEGTQPQSYVAGDYIGMRVTAAGLANFAQNAAVELGLDGKVDKVEGKSLSSRDYTAADMDKLGGIAEQATKNATDAQLRDRSTHTGVQPMTSITGLQASLDIKVDKIAGKDLSTNDYSTAEKTKLADVASGATANATDAQLRDRSTHTGVQPMASITGLQVALDSKVDKVAGKDLSTNDYSGADKSKLAGIAAGATANATNAELRNRNTHTGTQAMDTVDGLAAALGDKAPLQVPTITGLREAIVAMPANNIDLATANRFTKTIAANTTISISNPPPAGFCQAIVLRLTITAGAPTFWAGVVWDKGTPPTLTVGRTAEIAFLVGPNGTSTTAALISGDSR